MNPVTIAKLNKYISDDCFNKLRKTLFGNILKTSQERIINTEEKLCHISLHKYFAVYVEKSSKAVYLVAEQQTENVSIVAWGSVIGSFIPLLILCRDKTVKPE